MHTRPVERGAWSVELHRVKVKECTSEPLDVRCYCHCDELPCPCCGGLHKQCVCRLLPRRRTLRRNLDNEPACVNKRLDRDLCEYAFFAIRWLTDFGGQAGVVCQRKNQSVLVKVPRRRRRPSHSLCERPH